MGSPNRRKVYYSRGAAGSDAMRRLEISAVWLVMLGSVAMIGSIPCTVVAGMINALAAYFATQTEGPQMVKFSSFTRRRITTIPST